MGKTKIAITLDQEYIDQLDTLTSQPQKAGFPLTLELKTVKLPKQS